MLRYQHIVALLWFHLLNHIRRIVATYIFPVLVIGLGALIILLYNSEPKAVKATLDDGSFSRNLDYWETYTGVCRGDGMALNDFYEKNVDGTLEVGIYDRYDSFYVRPTIGFEDSNWLVQFNSALCKLLDEDTLLTVKTPMYSLADRRYVFSSWDTFSFSVFLFYCIVLSELHQDKGRRTDEFLWSLGVSSSEKMLSWYISILLQASLWSAINFTQFVPRLLQLETNVVFLWFLYTLVFFSTAIWAFVSSKFVKGTLTYIVAVMHMLLLWLFVLVYFLMAEQPMPESKALRFACLLHPIAQSYNLFRLTIAAEFSKTGLSVFTMTSYFGNPETMFFGTGLQTFLLMFLSSLVCTILFLVNFEFIYNKLIALIRSKSQASLDFGCDPTVKVEEIQMDANPTVEVHNLSKVYPNGFQAVSNVSFSIYPGEMIGLLGKNGAGKSTTMNVIAGFHEASAGQVLVNGIDISSRRNEAIGTLSFCPQEDRFFYRLTVLEHLKFVCLLKGTKYDAAHAMQLLKDLGIEQKSGAKPRNISGGQKRRVCIAMAYVAKSPLIILDEPTSAVDAATRKTLWSFFQAKQKENPEQAVILCTHFMQEADVLSQRIAIISDGCLRAFGSSPYLKGLFGVGYTVSFHSERQNEVEKLVTGVLREGTTFRQTSETESAFQVPMEYSSQLCSILGELERREIEYNFNASTLENVFVVLSTPPPSVDEDFRRKNDSADSNLNGSCENMDEVDRVLPQETEKPSDPSLLMETFLLQFKFSILIDFVRLFRKNWAFFLGYTIFFIAFPQLVLLICNIDNIIESSDPLEDGNITINMLTINKVPKIALFGAAPEVKVDILREAIGVPEIQIDEKYTEQEFLDAYYKHPLDLYDEYSFMVSYDAQTEKFGCVLNSNFESSEALCKLTMINIYNKETGNKVDVAMKLYREERDARSSDYYYHGGDYDGPSDKNICRGTMYHYVAPVIYFCLLFHILRLEAQRNELGLSPFYLANGANPLFSLLNRIAGLIIIILIYLLVMLIIAEVLGYGFFLSPNNKWAPALSGKNIGFFFLFSISFACFAILFGKATSSVILLLFVSAITGVLYMIFFGQKDFRTSSMKTSGWFFLLVYPGYILPVGPFGMIYSHETKISDSEIITSLSIQITVYLVLICLIESLSMRLAINAIAYLIGRRTTPPLTSPDEDIAVSVHEVSHTYFSMELEVPCCCCCKGRSRKCSVFKLTRALKGMSLQVPKNTCYALLGVNGAGKSTMFEILTGGNRLQRGHVSILDYSLLWRPLAIMKEIGYCSQKDKIPGYLTGNTILRLFGQLRGLSEEAIERQKQYMVKVMDVASHMDKPISGCSGGTKRKLSTMVAFIGFPKVIILDESTTGVDPITRMNFGKLIREAKKNGSTVIISSHTMEECESAADSICIMTRGKKHCEGTAEELKAQYGKFYSVTIKVPEHDKMGGSSVSLNNAALQQPSTSTMATNNVQININGDQVDAAAMSGPSYHQQNLAFPPPPAYSAHESVSNLLTQQFSGAELQYSFSAGLFRHLFFNIPKQDTRLSELFSRLDAMKRQNMFAECIVNTASLEHIFMQIAMEDEYAKNNPTAVTENP